MQNRPSPILKLFFKFPIFLHKLGLGGWERLFGARWMLIITTGRKTGRLRETMVDVMDYDKLQDVYFIESARGEKADWVRNIRANPKFEAQVGRRKFNASAETLPPEKTSEFMIAFYRRNPAYTRAVMSAAGMKFKSEDELAKISAALTLFCIKPEK